jgi:hypothetical protein
LGVIFTLARISTRTDLPANPARNTQSQVDVALM